MRESEESIWIITATPTSDFLLAPCYPDCVGYVMMPLNNLVANSAKGKKKKQIEQSKQTCDLQQKLSR